MIVPKVGATTQADFNNFQPMDITQIQSSQARNHFALQITKPEVSFFDVITNKCSTNFKVNFLCKFIEYEGNKCTLRKHIHLSYAATKVSLFGPSLKHQRATIFK